MTDNVIAYAIQRDWDCLNRAIFALLLAVSVASAIWIFVMDCRRSGAGL